MLGKGFDIIKGSNAIRGSNETAMKVLSSIKKTNLKIHYCTARTKDAFQYVNRLKKRLKNVKKPLDIITETNDLLRGAIYFSIRPGFDYQKRLDALKKNKKMFRDYVNSLHLFANYLLKQYDLPENLIELDKERLRILTSLEIVSNLKDEIKKKGFKPAIVEEIPAYDLPILRLEWL
jgi:pyruvate formate-lyase activating enzyme-like uncharacterized protein